LTTAAVVALTGTLAFAAPHGGHEGGRHGRGEGGEFGERFAQKLNLSAAQQQQIKDIETSFREENKAFFQSARDTREQMKAAKDAGDTARLEQLKATAESQHTQMKSLRGAQMQRIDAILTPDQRAQLQALKAERAARRGEHGEGRDHRD
jgi:Spy/CpxP family protein refolding chaperone